MSPDELKIKLRQECKERLANLDFKALITKSAKLSELFFLWTKENAHLFQNRAIVSFYPFGNEPGLNIELEDKSEPYRISYVRVENWKRGEMEAYYLRRDLPGIWEEIELKGETKIFQPVPTLPKCASDEIAVVLVPGLAFTRTGDRLGRGAGFYDRFLARNPSALRVGVAFEEQILPKLPVDSWDILVDVLLTDSGMFPMKSYGEWKKHGKLVREG